MARIISPRIRTISWINRPGAAYYNGGATVNRSQ